MTDELEEAFKRVEAFKEMVEGDKARQAFLESRAGYLNAGLNEGLVEQKESPIGYKTQDVVGEDVPVQPLDVDDLEWYEIPVPPVQLDLRDQPAWVDLDGQECFWHVLPFWDCEQPVSERARELAREMTERRWVVPDPPITLSPDAKLIDGQHVSEAVKWSARHAEQAMRGRWVRTIRGEAAIVAGDSEEMEVCVAPRPEPLPLLHPSYLNHRYIIDLLPSPPPPLLFDLLLLP